MDLNLAVLEGLKIVGDSISVPDQAFDLLHTSAHEYVIDTTKKDLGHLDKFPGVDVSVGKQCFYALTTVIVESARKNVEESELSSLLEECKWPNDRQETFIKKIKVHRNELQINLCRIDSSYPHIVDVNWRLDYCIKSNQIEKINDSNYLISFKTQEPGKEGNVKFFCSVDQLQDLVSKLKDATKTIEKASQG